jgi:hypothetical protein
VDGHLIGPVALVLRAGSELIRTLLLSPLPCSNGDSPRRSEADRGYPVSTADSASFGMVDPGVPRQVVCLAAGQARQETECGGEACALAESWCLIACLTPTTAVRGDHGAGNTGL